MRGLEKVGGSMETIGILCTHIHTCAAEKPKSSRRHASQEPASSSMRGDQAFWAQAGREERVVGRVWGLRGWQEWARLLADRVGRGAVCKIIQLERVLAEWRARSETE